MIARLMQVEFDLNEPFKALAQSVNPALPGMPIAPAGWANCGSSAYGLDAAGNVWSWALADVSPSGVVTLHAVTGGVGLAMAWLLGQPGGASVFPPVAAALPPSSGNTSSVVGPIAPNPFGVTAGQ